MKILVTGGAGFIGSHVVDAYIVAGHSVAVIDNLKTGFERNVNPKARFYKVDITDAVAVNEVFKKEQPDVVNHHAAIAEVVKSITEPLPTYTVNVLGTINVLMAFGQYGAKTGARFIFSSTGGAIYGNAKELPATEQTPAAPLTAYGMSKLLGEEVITFYAHQFAFTPIIFRYPNVYGPRQNPKGEAGVVAIFVGAMLRGETPTIFGDGKKTRDYVYVADITKANVTALTLGDHEIINIGSGQETSDDQIFEATAAAAGFKGAVTYAPHREGEVLRISIAAPKAKKLFGWQPTMVLKDGVLEVASQIRKTGNN